MASQSSPAANNSSFFTTLWNTPSPYPPCTRASNELDPTVISQMERETHHRGKRIAVRVETSPTRTQLDPLLTVVEDVEGKQAFLQLLHQPRETVVPAEQILRPGCCYLIKEPFLTVSIDGAYYNLRVDHPSDILLLPDGHELLPAKWRNDNAVVRKSCDTRRDGNIAFVNERWAEAESLYTTAARTAETAEDFKSAYLNRSWTNLHLGRPATALADAIKSYGGDSSARTEIALWQEARALYELAEYEQCLDRLQIFRTANPGSDPAMQLNNRTHARLREKHSGQYDFRDMYQQAQVSPLIDCATYGLAVEIRDSPGKGRGVFTTRKVLAGELLICEKAFGYSWCANNVPGSKNMTKRDIGTKYLHTHIVQKMLHNIEAARSFGDLHHGDYDAVSVHEVDGRPVVDSFLVQKVIDLVSLEGPRTSLSAYQDFVSIGDEDQDDDVSNVGVWHLISHINHSCISNTNDSLIGDMRIVRATRDLEKGSELFMSYQASFDVDSYEEMQERLRPWGFTCDCALCLDRKATPKEVLMKRDSLLQILMQLLESQSRNMDITYAQLKKTLQSLEQTYSATAKMSGAARPVLWISYFTLGSELLDIEGPSEAIEMTLKGLEALGFVISASPPRWRPESSEPELLINRWGVTNRPTVDAFLALHRAYKKIAPQLSVVARKYMELAYSMVVGEKETILDSYPDMA